MNMELLLLHQGHAVVAMEESSYMVLRFVHWNINGDAMDISIYTYTYIIYVLN